LVARVATVAAVAAAAIVLARPATAQVKDWPAEAPPRPLPSRDARFPPYELRTLANGLQVVVVMHHEQPVVSLRLLVRAGSAADPDGKPGVAWMTAALLDQGTLTRTAAQVADTIDSIGGELSAGAGSDLSFVNVVVMKDSFEVGLGLLSEVARSPAFDAQELERQRQQALSSLTVNAQDPDYVASMVLDRLVYGFHPYGLPGTGTTESLPGITPADLHAFHDHYFAPNNAILAVVGDVTAVDAFAAAERVFGPWPRRTVSAVPRAEPPPPARRLVIVDKPDAVQTEVRVGQVTIPRKHPDYTAMDLAIKILGGEGSNRLHRVLRSERGLTYGAEAELQALEQAGDFAANTDTRTETTVEVLRLVVDEITKLQRERVNERELADAQAYLTGSFPLTIETPGAIAAQVVNAIFYGLPLSELENYRERVSAITPDDIQRVAREYLRPDRLSVVLVGNAKVFTGQLKGLGFDTYEIVPIRDLDITAANLRRGGPAAASTGRPSQSPQ